MIGTDTIGERRRMTEEQPVVFVIDDDQLVRDGVNDLLRSIGLRVESCRGRADWNFNARWRNRASSSR